MLDYDTEISKLTPAEREGRAAVEEYEWCGCRHFFSWYDIDAPGLHAAVSKTQSGARLAREALDQGISQADYVLGIDFWLALRRKAEPWAWRMAGTYIDEGDYEDDEFVIRDCYVDAYISQEADRSPLLEKIIKTNPLLHAMICIETSRHLNAITRRPDAE